MEAKVSVLKGQPVRRNLNVENATNDLDAATSLLREAISDLAEHLGPILAPERPHEPGKDRSEGDSEVAERILTNIDRVQGVTDRIRDLIARL